MGRGTTVEPHLPIVVVGSGLSGLVVATELAKARLSPIVLIEAGGDFGATHEAQSGSAIPRHRPWGTPSAPFFADGAGLKSRVGGRSLCWHGVVLRIDDGVLEDGGWPSEIPVELNGDGRAGYAAVEASLARWCGRALDKWSEEECPPSAIEEVSRLTGWQLLSVPKAVQRVRPGAWKPFSPLYEWTNGPHATIISDRVVTRCICSKDKCVGVEVKSAGGSTSVIDARSVVLAAGTIENGRLLAQCSAGPGPGTIILPNLTDHLVQGCMVPLRSNLLTSSGLVDANGLHAYCGTQQPNRITSCSAPS